jgi:hypothetical protein
VLAVVGVEIDDARDVGPRGVLGRSSSNERSALPSLVKMTS